MPSLEIVTSVPRDPAIDAIKNKELEEAAYKLQIIYSLLSTLIADREKCEAILRAAGINPDTLIHQCDGDSVGRISEHRINNPHTS